MASNAESCQAQDGDQDNSCINKKDQPFAENNVRDHLVIMVNGIMGSAEDWRFAADQLVKKFPDKLIVHCSQRNISKLTLDGVDVMGERLADEVDTVIKCYPGVKKISFIAHSVGGLVARYAIGRLYKLPSSSKATVDTKGELLNEDIFPNDKEQSSGNIAGLEPVNFITVATPHLGSKGKNQVPFLLGVPLFEKVACLGVQLAIGRTGRHLFLTDTDTNEGKLPLLRRMVNDCDGLYFISALGAFKRRVAYSNVINDLVVGWRTSSIRRENELPKLQDPLDERYPHIVNVENENDESHKPGAYTSNGQAIDQEEEEIVAGLTQFPWQRVDASFNGSKRKFDAHSTIQVKSYRMHSEGADVIFHMIDNFRV